MRAEFTFGAACGLTLAGLMALSEDPCVHGVEPFAWKGALVLGPDKRSSLLMASRLLGDRSVCWGPHPATTGPKRSSSCTTWNCSFYRRDDCPFYDRYRLYFNVA